MVYFYIGDFKRSDLLVETLRKRLFRCFSGFSLHQGAAAFSVKLVFKRKLPNKDLSSPFLIGLDKVTKKMAIGAF
jgi:hypothetical protein